MLKRLPPAPVNPLASIALPAAKEADAKVKLSPSEAAIMEKIESLDSELKKKNAEISQDQGPLSAAATEAMNGLLERVKVAEAAAEALRKQLAAAATANAAGDAQSGSQNKQIPALMPALGRMTVGVDPAELRKLKKRIKELEAGGGGGGGAVDQKAVAAAEKKYQKQIKDLETQAKKAQVRHNCSV